MMSFNFQTADRIVSGWNSLEQLSEHLDAMHDVTLKKVLIISMEALVVQGFVPSIEAILQEKGAETVVMTDIMPEPSESHIEEVMERIKGTSFDLMIGIGGGSVLDATKIFSVLATNDLSVREMVGIGNVKKPGIPTVLIPTTAGTGAEVTPNAIVTLEEEKLKAGIVSPFLYPRLVILDASLTVLLPKPITAATGMDAYTHALESFISTKANPVSDMFAKESMRLISESLLNSYDNGDSKKDREQMLIGSMYGGLALSASGTAAVHALAYPLGGEFNVAHGVANSMLLPHVMRFNADKIQDRLKQAAIISGAATNEDSPADATEKLLDMLVKWVEHMNIPQNLKEFGVTENDIPRMAVAASNVKRLMDNNPKVMSLEDIENVYRKLL